MCIRLSCVLLLLPVVAFSLTTSGAIKATPISSLPMHSCQPNACAGTMAGWDDQPAVIPPVDVQCIITPGQPAFNNCQFDITSEGCTDAPSGMVDCLGTWVVNEFPLQTKRCVARFVTCNPRQLAGR